MIPETPAWTYVFIAGSRAAGNGSRAVGGRARSPASHRRRLRFYRPLRGPCKTATRAALGHTTAHRRFWICLTRLCAGPKLCWFGSKFSFPTNVVGAPFLARYVQILALSVLFVPFTPAPRTSHAVQDAVACESNTR